MGDLSELELYCHLPQEACVNLVPATLRHVTITPDGRRYKKTELDRTPCTWPKRCSSARQTRL